MQTILKNTTQDELVNSTQLSQALIAFMMSRGEHPKECVLSLLMLATTLNDEQQELSDDDFLKVIEETKKGWKESSQHGQTFLNHVLTKNNER